MPRRRLVERLNLCRHAPLTLVSAPAGFGKTTLLTEWAAEFPDDVAWATLDGRHRDPNRLGRALVAAVERIAPGFGASVLATVDHEQATGAEAGLALADALVLHGGDLFLVLDDFQIAASAESEAFLTALVRGASPSLHLLVSTRNDPALPLARMRLLGQVVEVRAGDLRFSHDEARALLAHVGRGGDDPVLAEVLLQQTGGWIAGLRLATLALPSVADPTRIADEIAADRHLMDYLIEEVLESQPPATRSFLVRTSIADRLCAPLAAAILGNPDPQSCRDILDRLAHESLFVERIEGTGDWIRFHPLFRSLLLHQLQARTGPDEIETLHRRAGDWFVEHGPLDAAIGHLVAAGDPIAAARAVEARVHPALNREDWNAVAGWLAVLPDAIVRERPVLLLAKGWVSRLSGRSVPVRSILAQVADLLTAWPPGDPERERLLAECDVLNNVLFYTSDRDPVAELTRSREILARVSPTQRFPYGLAVYSHGCALQAAGWSDEAVRFLTDMAQRDEERIDAGTIRSLGGLMWVQRQAGNYLGCRDTASHALLLARRHDLPLAAGWCRWLLGWLAYRRDEIDEAAGHFSAVLADHERVHLHCACESAFGLALAQQAAGRAADADATVARLLDLILDANALEYLPLLRAFKARLALLQGAAGRAADWLSMGDVVSLGCNSLDAFDHAFVTRIRVLVAEGSASSLAVAAHDIDEFSAFTALVHHHGHEIDLLILAALVATGPEAAMQPLRRAVELAARGGIVRPFIDAGGSIGSLLALLDRERRAPVAFLSRLRAAVGGGLSDGPPEPHAVANQRPAGALQGLTERERDVLECLVRRLSYQEIGDELFIALPTVKSHVRNIYEKLGVGNRRDALAKAESLGWSPRRPIGQPDVGDRP